MDQSRPSFARLFGKNINFKDVPRCPGTPMNCKWKKEVFDFHPLTFVVVFIFCICPEMNRKTDGKMRFHTTSRLSWGAFTDASSGRRACGKMPNSIEKLKSVRLQKP